MVTKLTGDPIGERNKRAWPPARWSCGPTGDLRRPKAIRLAAMNSAAGGICAFAQQTRVVLVVNGMMNDSPRLPASAGVAQSCSSGELRCCVARHPGKRRSFERSAPTRCVPPRRIATATAAELRACTASARRRCLHGRARRISAVCSCARRNTIVAMAGAFMGGMSQRKRRGFRALRARPPGTWTINRLTCRDAMCQAVQVTPDAPDGCRP